MHQYREALETSPDTQHVTDCQFVLGHSGRCQASSKLTRPRRTSSFAETASSGQRMRNQAPRQAALSGDSVVIAGMRS